MKNILVGQLRSGMTIAYNRIVNHSKKLVSYKIIAVDFNEADRDGYSCATLTLQGEESAGTHKETWYTIESVILLEEV